MQLRDSLRLIHCGLAGFGASFRNMYVLLLRLFFILISAFLKNIYPKAQGFLGNKKSENNNGLSALASTYL